MNTEALKVDIELINDGIKFSSISGENPEIVTDFYPPLGNNEGYKPLELFLISFGTCVGGTILPLLRSFRKNIEKFHIKAEGIRRSKHPTSFEKIILNINIKSEDTVESDLQKAIDLSEETYCPIWAMIKNNVEIDIKFNIVN